MRLVCVCIHKVLSQSSVIFTPYVNVFIMYYCDVLYFSDAKSHHGDYHSYYASAHK